jgi:hypothetical protein
MGNSESSLVNNGTNNYSDIFTYEKKQYCDAQNNNASYTNCVLLKDVGKMKTGEKVPFIAINYQLCGFDENNKELFVDFITDTSTAKESIVQ